jgi:succinate-semialdehyde dehydrogenase/glutarate-semialdehyde dehydrogenase
MLFKPHAFINRHFGNAKSCRTFEVANPVSSKIIGTIPKMDKEDTQTTIDAAAALPSFCKTTLRDRSRMLHRWYQLVMDNTENLGKPIT